MAYLFYGTEEERIYHPVGDDMGYLEDTGNHDARTEGMSYGMMICVQMDKKEEFDRIWKWACTYMWMEDGENEGYFAWSCATDGSKNATGPAPDGEEFLPWRFSLLPIDGETEKGFSAIQSRQKRSCGHAFIRDRTEDAEPPCGTLQISRFCLCREATIRILPIICHIFMNCLPYGQMRKTVHSLRRQRR